MNICTLRDYYFVTCSLGPLVGTVSGIMSWFALDIEATKITELTGLSRKTINTVLYKIRERVAEYCQQQSPFDKEPVSGSSGFGEPNSL